VQLTRSRRPTFGTATSTAGKRVRVAHATLVRASFHQSFIPYVVLAGNRIASRARADPSLKGRGIDSEPVEASPAYWQNDCALGASTRVNLRTLPFSRVQRSLNEEVRNGCRHRPVKYPKIAITSAKLGVRSRLPLAAGGPSSRACALSCRCRTHSSWPLDNE